MKKVLSCDIPRRGSAPHVSYTPDAFPLTRHEAFAPAVFHKNNLTRHKQRSIFIVVSGGNMKTDAEILANRVTKQYNKCREIQREKYIFAKENGFTAIEAVVLQNWSWDRIKLLAKTRVAEPQA